MSNQQLEEKLQEDADRELAKKLGISYKEIIDLDYEIHENESEDGVVYGQYVEFSKDVAPEILKKIKGLDQNYTVYI